MFAGLIGQDLGKVLNKAVVGGIAGGVVGSAYKAATGQDTNVGNSVLWGAAIGGGLGLMRQAGVNKGWGQLGKNISKHFEAGAEAVGNVAGTVADSGVGKKGMGIFGSANDWLNTNGKDILDSVDGSIKDAIKNKSDGYLAKHPGLTKALPHMAAGAFKGAAYGALAGGVYGAASPNETIAGGAFSGAVYGAMAGAAFYGMNKGFGKVLANKPLKQIKSGVDPTTYEGLMNGAGNRAKSTTGAGYKQTVGRANYSPSSNYKDMNKVMDDAVTSFDIQKNGRLLPEHAQSAWESVTPLRRTELSSTGSKMKNGTMFNKKTAPFIDQNGFEQVHDPASRFKV